MTEVYQSLPTSNEVEDRYARNEIARKTILGPLSVVIKCLGFDSTYSLFKEETRRRPISCLATPITVIGIIVLIANMFQKKDEIDGFSTISWKWAETFLIFFLAINSLISAIFLMRRTHTLFFLTYFEAWSECARLSEKEKEGKVNGDAEIGRSSSSNLFTSGRLIKVLLAFLVFIGSTISTSTKYAVYQGNYQHGNENVTTPLLDKFHGFEPLLSLWGAILSATALSVYGILHGIIEDTIIDFNNDLKTASDSKTLSTRIDYFSIRHQSILIFARTLSKKMCTFATYSMVTMIVVNFASMYLSIAQKEGTGGLGILCFIFWQIIAISSMVVVLFQAAAIQLKLNKSCEILVADKEIWIGDLAVAQQAQMMITKRQTTETTVSLLKCLKLTPWIANGVMLVPPIIGGTFALIKVFFLH